MKNIVERAREYIDLDSPFSDLEMAQALLDAVECLEFYADAKELSHDRLCEHAFRARATLRKIGEME